jgi:hypothetical protein
MAELMRLPDAKRSMEVSILAREFAKCRCAVRDATFGPISMDIISIPKVNKPPYFCKL